MVFPKPYVPTKNAQTVGVMVGIKFQYLWVHLNSHVKSVTEQVWLKINKYFLPLPHFLERRSY